MKANAQAAKRRLELLNQEYRMREQVRQLSKVKPRHESFGEAVARIAREDRVTI